jgi:hypothetical protein
MSPPVRVKIVGQVNEFKSNGDELFAQEELTYLNRLDITKENTLVARAVVVTEQFVFFIVSSEKVEVNGESVFGISTKAIYANEGLEKRK